MFASSSGAPSSVTWPLTVAAAGAQPATDARAAKPSTATAPCSRRRAQRPKGGIFNLKDLFRQAGRQGIIANVESWFAYLKGRNLTSHTYNEKTAEETYQLAAAFLDDVQALLDELRKRCEPGHH